MLVALFILACRDTTAPARDQCLAGYADACFDAAIVETNPRDRGRFFNKCSKAGDASCKLDIRDSIQAPWLDSATPERARIALHAYAVTCHQGKPAACFEVGNWLLWDFASPAAAVAPFQIACEAKFADACERLDIAREAAKTPTNAAPPSRYNL